MKIFAMLCKIVVPGLMVIAAIASGARKLKGEQEDEKMKRIAYIMVGVVSIFIVAIAFLFSMIGRNGGNMLDNINRNGEIAIEKAQKNQQQTK